MSNITNNSNVAVNNDVSRVFNSIYDNDVWSRGEHVLPNVKGSSGLGSNPIHNGPYLSYLQNFINDQTRGIKTVVDLGCGDWNISHKLDWSNVNYTGIDCVKKVIDDINVLHGKDNIKFVCQDISVVDGLPKADLCIIKDVLQHWPNDMIINFLTEVIRRGLFRYILITNCKTEAHSGSCQLGSFRGLSADIEPLKTFKATTVLTYFTKATCLITC